MSGFDHSVFAEQVAGVIDYVAGNRKLSYGTVAPFGFTCEPLPPEKALAYQRLPGESGGPVAITVATAVFAGKLPTEGESFRDNTQTPAINYRIHKREGGGAHPAVRFICTASAVAS